jgi:hypothetical protein
MNKLYQSALLGAVSVLLAACGANNSSTQPAPAQSAVMGHSSAQAGHSQADYNLTMQKVYLAYFGRPADAAGLDYYTDNLLRLSAATDLTGLNAQIEANVSGDIGALLDSFSNSQESQDLYAGDNSAFLDAVYQSLFNRPADAAGKAYWLGQINAGIVSRSRAALNIMSGAQGSDVDIINAKAAVANQFTSSLVLGEQRRAYSGLAANVTVRTMMHGVDASTTVDAFIPTINTTIAQLIAAAPASAQGLYAAHLANTGTTDIDLLVTDDDQIWSFYGVQRATLFEVAGFTAAQASSDGSTISTANMTEYGNLVSHETASFSYAGGTPIHGAIETTGGPLAITTTAVAGNVFNYAAVADVATVAGSWSMQTKNGTATVQIDASGAISGTSTTTSNPACAFTGALTPHTGRNAYDLVLTYSASCALSGQTAKGLGISMLQNNGGNRELILMVQNSTHTGGAFYYGVR